MNQERGSSSSVVLALIIIFALAALGVVAIFRPENRNSSKESEAVKQPRIEVVAWTVHPVGEKHPDRDVTPVYAVKVGNIDPYGDDTEFFSSLEGSIHLWEKYRNASEGRAEVLFKGKLPSPIDLMEDKELRLISRIISLGGNLSVELKNDITPKELYWFSGNLGCLLRTKKYC